MNSTVGPLSYRQDQDGFQKPFSEKTAELLDAEVRKMVNLAHTRTTDLLTEKKEEVEKVAQLLLAREVLSRCVVSPPPLLVAEHELNLFFFSFFFLLSMTVATT
jgi:ATP-dependent Zn protease